MSASLRERAVTRFPTDRDGRLMTVTRPDAAAPTRLSTTQKKQVLAGALGNAVEYVDWAIYASLATVFAPKFFPAGEESAALLGALAIFATAFIMRPVG